MIKHIKNNTHFCIIDKIPSKGKYIDGLILGNKGNKNPLFAVTVGKDKIFLSDKIKNLVYIPAFVLKDISKIKVVKGKKESYHYDIWKNIRFENENAFTVEITEYRPERKQRADYIETVESEVIYTDAVPF
jgi:hypothetical protein